MDRNPRLKVVEGALAGQLFDVTAEGLTVGRGDDCHVRLPDPGVSREHARIFLHNAGVWVQDLGSRNGVFVKGSRITRAKQLSPGTKVSVGDHTFLLVLGADADGHPADAAAIPISEGPTVLSAAPPVSDTEPEVVADGPESGSKKALVLGVAVAGVLLLLGWIAASLLAG